MKIKKISSILSLLAIMQPIIQNNQIFAKEIHNSKISENEVKNLDATAETKPDDKINIDEKKTDIKKKNYKKTAAIATLSTLLLASLGVGGTIGGWQLYLHKLVYEANKNIGGVLSCSPSKYMDKQTDSAWCQLYAYQGMLNKEFKIKPKIEELYELAFPGDSSYDKEKFMPDEKTREEFVKRTISKYSLNRKPYVNTFDMKAVTYADQKEYARLIIGTIWGKIKDALTKCGSICINTDTFLEHAMLVTGWHDNDQGSHIIEFETWGKKYEMHWYDFIKNYVLVPYSHVQTPRGL